MEKERDYSIDILRFMAAIFITWSHFEKPLGDYAVLATGGAFGDTMFFFVSGYTLLLSNRFISFANWYKRRINRIYPTVFAWALLSSIIWNNNLNMFETILYGGGFFVTCIMIFYLLFYPIKCYLINHMWKAVVVCFITQAFAYFFIDHSNVDLDYYWKWSSYFIAMLMGAIIGRRKKQSINYNIDCNCRLVKNVIGLVVFAILYYIMMYLELTHAILAIFNVIPLIGFVCNFYNICNTSIFKKVYENKIANAIIMTIGGLCLEIYIVQPSLLTDELNHLFPFNLFIMFFVIFVVAYFLKCLSRMWSQSFKEENYDWKDIIKAY